MGFAAAEDDCKVFEGAVDLGQSSRGEWEIAVEARAGRVVAPAEQQLEAAVEIEGEAVVAAMAWDRASSSRSTCGIGTPAAALHVQ